MARSLPQQTARAIAHHSLPDLTTRDDPYARNGQAIRGCP